MEKDMVGEERWGRLNLFLQLGLLMRQKFRVSSIERQILGILKMRLWLQRLSLLVVELMLKPERQKLPLQRPTIVVIRDAQVLLATHTPMRYRGKRQISKRICKSFSPSHFSTSRISSTND